MQMWARPGFEWAKDGLVGLWCPVSTGATGFSVLDGSGFANHGRLTGYANESQPWVGFESGTVLNFDGTDDHVYIPDASNLDLRTTMSMSIWCKTGSDVSAVRMLAAKAIISPLALSYRVWIQTRLNFQISQDGGVTNIGTRQSSPLATNRLYHFFVRFVGGSIQDICVDGSTDNALFSGTIRPSIYSAPTPIPLIIGAQAATATTTSGPFSGQIMDLCIWDKAIGDEQVRELNRVGPGGAWQLTPRIRRYSALLAQAYAIAADTGSFVLAGFPANLLAGRSITADQAQYVLSGQATGLQASRLLEADRGNFALTGLNAATLLGRLLDAEASAYSLNGSATDLLSARRITADQAVLLATGQDAGLSVSRKLGASTGQFILVASDVNFTTSSGGAAPYYYLFMLGGAR